MTRVRDSLLDAARDRHAASDTARVGGSTAGRVLATYVGAAEDGVRALVRFEEQAEPVPLPAPPGTYVPQGRVWVSVDERRKPVAVLGPVDEGPEDEAPEVLMPRLASAQDIEARADLQRAMDDMRELGLTLEEADSALSDALAQVPRIITSSRWPTTGDTAPEGSLWWVLTATNPPTVGVRYRMSNIGWTREFTSGTSIESLDVSKLRASSLAVDSAAVSKLWAEVVVARFLTATEKIITKDVLADGAVTARTLNVVTTAPGSNSALSLKPDGLRIFDADQMGPTGNPLEAPRVSLVAGEVGLSFTDATGEVAASVTPGGVTGKVGAFSDSLAYRGDELSDLLRRLPQGVLARGTMSGAAKPTAAGTPMGLVTLNWQVPEWFTGPLRDRTLRVSGNFTASHGVNLTETRVRIHKAAMGAVSTSNSVLATLFMGKPQDAGYHERPFSVVFTTGEQFGADVVPGATLRLLMSVESPGSGMDVRVDAGNTWLLLEDLGPATDATQTTVSAPSTSTGVAPKTEYVAEYDATGFTSYRSGGSSVYTASPGSRFPVQGQTPYAAGNGVTGAHVFFDSARIRSDLAGATVKSVEVRFTVQHTHSNSGGTLGLWTHAYTSSPGRIATMNYVGEAKFAPGSSRWLGLPTDGWATGARRGVGLFPPGGSASSEYYLYTSPAVKLRVVYLK